MADPPATSEDDSGDEDGGESPDSTGMGSQSDEEGNKSENIPDSVPDVAPEEADPDDLTEAELEALVEQKYDFEEFGPREMREMEPEEWDAAFDADAWITGEQLLDRVEADLEHRVATRDVFAVVERVTHEGEPAVLAYTDDGYAMITGDGAIEGFGTVLRDAKPVVALCSMDSYDVPDAPEADFLLPHPDEVVEGSRELGNLMIQVVAAIHVLAGLVLMSAALYFAATEYLGAPAYLGAATGGAIVVSLAVALVFVAVGVVLFVTVANARLSDRFRAEEYRERLRRMGLEDGERPEFLPVEGRARELTDEDRGDS